MTPIPPRTPGEQSLVDQGFVQTSPGIFAKIKPESPKQSEPEKPLPNKQCRWKSDWIVCGGKRIFARSLWEANYARYLEWQKSQGLIADWEHEPKTFWFEKIRRGVRSYLPDFKVTMNNAKHEWHEVKGWMDARSKTKLKRMAKYHPAETVRILDGSWFKDANRNMAGIVPGWATIRSNHDRSIRLRSMKC